MEFIVETDVPTSAAQTLLQGLLDRLDLTGGNAEVLFGEADVASSNVHIAFQVEASDWRRAESEVKKVMRPVLSELSAGEATYHAREVQVWEEAQAKRRWAFPVPRMMAFPLAGLAAGGIFAVLHATSMMGGRQSGVAYMIINMITN